MERTCVFQSDSDIRNFMDKFKIHIDFKILSSCNYEIEK